MVGFTACDYHQRLVRITKYSSANAVLWTVTYEYDGLDRRICRTVRNAASTVTAQQRFLYDSNVLSSAHPLGGDGALRADEAANWEPVIVLDERLAGEPYQEVDHRYLNGPLIDQVFADETGGNGVLWYLSDAQNTVRDVAKYGSTTAGTQATVRNHLEYNTFGIVTTADDPTTATVNDGDRPGLEGAGNEFSPQRSYTGREPDHATGLIYYRARWFDPRIGRFISEDPIGFAAGDANLSRYVGNSAPNAVDPSGHSALSKLGTLIKKAIKGGNEKAIREGVEKELRDEYYKMMAKILAEEGLGGLVQIHHLIAQQFFDPRTHKKIAKFLDDIGITKDNARNCVELLTRKAIAEGYDIGKAALHDGGHIKSYVQSIVMAQRNTTQETPRHQSQDGQLSRWISSIRSRMCSSEQISWRMLPSTGITTFPAVQTLHMVQGADSV